MIHTHMKKWGRGTLAAGLAALFILLSACGQVKSGVTSDTPEQKTDSLPAGSGENRDTASDPIERLSGTFFIDGDKNAASVVIEPDGSFTAYYASGTPEQEGYVRYETDESGFNVYVFYTQEGKPYMGFVDSGESRISEFETGNGSYRYVRAE